MFKEKKDILSYNFDDQDSRISKKKNPYNRDKFNIRDWVEEDEDDLID